MYNIYIYLLTHSSFLITKCAFHIIRMLILFIWMPWTRNPCNVWYDTCYSFHETKWYTKRNPQFSAQLLFPSLFRVIVILHVFICFSGIYTVAKNWMSPIRCDWWIYLCPRISFICYYLRLYLIISAKLFEVNKNIKKH